MGAILGDFAQAAGQVGPSLAKQLAAEGQEKGTAESLGKMKDELENMERQVTLPNRTRNYAWRQQQVTSGTVFPQSYTRVEYLRETLQVRSD